MSDQCTSWIQFGIEVTPIGNRERDIMQGYEHCVRESKEQLAFPCQFGFIVADVKL